MQRHSWLLLSMLGIGLGGFTVWSLSAGQESPTAPPAELVGLQPWSATLVPEPSTALLGLLGASALLLRRRH